MSQDEEGTVKTLKRYRDIIAQLVRINRGRVVDSPGDNVLAEFGSVVDAVKCAVKIQEDLKARNTELSENRRMEFRIGVNLGDVIEEEERLYGDGVNIAARLEGLSDGGGVCISGTAFDHVKNKLSVGYEYLGEQTVKNIPDPVRVYRVLMEPEYAGKVIDKEKPKPKKWRLAAIATVVVLVAVAGILIWNFYLRPPLMEPTSVDRMAVLLPDKPSIAVLPFTNLSGNPNQDYFSDGITIDIITDLSKFREMFVIASNTVFTYKGKAVKVKDVARELGVRYVLEGSVQKVSERVRVNAQLIDATKGHHLWADRYDRNLKGLFAMQDEIVQMIVMTLSIELTHLEQDRAFAKATANLEAYDYVLRGWEYESRATRSANFEARKMFQKAIELDPDYSSAYVGLGKTHRNACLQGWAEVPTQAWKQTQALAQKAINLDESNAAAHGLLGEVYCYWGEYDLAIRELERALELNPNDWKSYVDRGRVMLWSSQPDEAIKSLEIALRFNPNMHPSQLMPLGLAYYLKERYDESIRTLERCIGRKPDSVWNHIVLAAAYSQAGRSEEAERSANMVLRLHPFFEVDAFGTAFRNPADRTRFAEGLRKAGLK
jgi:adenylate cyclase